MESSNLSRPALYGLALALILIWGSAFTFVSVAVDHVTPLWLVAGRMTIAALLLGSIGLLSRHRFPPLSDIRWRFYGALSLPGAILPFFLLAEGQKTVDSGLTAIITGAMPLFTILLAHWFTHEKLTPFKALGFVIGFAGVVVLFLPDTASLGLTQDWGAQLLIVLAALCYAITTVAAKRAPETPSVIGAAIMMICAAFLSVAVALILEPGQFDPNRTAWTMIILLGLGSTGIATIIYLYVIEQTGPSVMARLNYFVPPASVIFGVWFLDEPLTWKIPIAFLIIFAGVAISRIGVTRLTTTPSAPQTGLTDRP